LGAAAIFIGFRISVQGNADRELDLRLAGVQAFLQQAASSSEQVNLSREFEQHAGVRLHGDPIQIMDADGNWIYRPQSMIPLELEGIRPTILGTRTFSTIERNGGRFRILTATVAGDGALYTVQLASNVTPIYRLLHRFLVIAIASIPAILLFAGAGGFWLSRRAMQPVYEITKAASSISERSLSERLTVPEARDELRQLSETLNEMLARLEQAFAQITQFTADASHELRTPVAMIRTTAEHILQRERTVPEYQQMVGQILVESERTSDIITNLLVLARADQRAGQGARKPVNLREVIANLEMRFRVVANRNQLQFEVSQGDQPLFIVGNPQELENLFTILLDNAMKYTPAGGSVRVELGRNGGECSATVQDSGIGISGQDLGHIFDRFYRVDKARSMEDGAGLGLSIARSVADAHGAAITVSSVLGQGSKFCVRFPVRVA
jgi:heavy metal sensor kinase